MKNRSTIAAGSAIVFAILGIFAVGCMGPMHWDGWTSRQIVVTVFDENNNPLPNATITLEQPGASLPRNPSKEFIRTATTGSDGIGKLFVCFPAGGKKTLFTLIQEGSFGINGTLKVAAKDHSTFVKPLSVLVGKDNFPIGNKSAIHVRATLPGKK